MDNDKHIPGKRIKTWHRGNKSGKSLKSFARDLAAQTSPSAQTAREWLAGKRKPQTMKPPYAWRAA